MSESDAIESDLRTIAEEYGWTVEATRAREHAIQAAVEINLRISEERPSQLLGVSISATDPNAVPELYIKGKPDDLILELVAASPAPIRLIDNQPYSLSEMEARTTQVINTLAVMGFPSASAGFRFEGGGEMWAVVAERPGMRLNADTIQSNLPLATRGDVSITLIGKKVAESHSSYGGLLMSTGGSTGCTSGVAVKQLSTQIPGVVSAGHCSTKTKMYDPISNVWHSLVFRSQHQGQFGDVEWYSVGNAITKDDFIADFVNGAYQVRDVAAVRAFGAFAQGQTACVWGRVDKKKRCGQVENVSVITYSLPDAIPLRNMVMMDRGMGSNGDSGSTVFYNFTILGIYHGYFHDPEGNYLPKAVFSKADLLPLALGVQVITQ